MASIGELTATLGCDSSGLRRAEGDLRAFGSTADSTFSSAMRSAAALAATVLTAAAAYKVLTDVIQTGMRVETMGVVMNVIGKNVQISTQALQYFKKEVESTGVTGMEAMSALSKAMTLGLNLNQMKEFTTRVRDVAVGARDAAGNMMNTSQTVNAVMHGIQSGQVEVLRNLGVTVRGTEEVYKAYAKTIGKTKEELNDAQKAQAMFNEFMRASALMAGSAAAADETVGKQLASMARYSEEAKVALWSIFQPGMMAAVQGMTQGFIDLKKWAESNSAALSALGIQIGEFVAGSISAAGSVVKWGAANTTLLKGITELYILGRIVSWSASAVIALQALAVTLTSTGAAVITLRTLAAGPWPAIIITATALGITTALTSLRNLAEQYLVTKGIIERNRMTQPHGYVVQGEVISSGGSKPLNLEARSQVLVDSEKQVNAQARINTELGKEITARSNILKLTFPVGNLLEQGALTTKMMADRTLAAKSKDEADAAAAKALAAAGGAGKVDKGAAAEINRLNSLFDTLTKDIARLSEGKLSAIEADYVKTVENIFKKTSDRAHSEAEVEIMAKTRATLQKGKLQDDFDLKMAKGSGDAFLEINEQYQKDLLDYNGLAGAKEKIDAFYGRQRVIKEVERVSEVLNLQKTYVDAMASASPIITDQLTWKKQSLDLENQLAQAAIAKTIAEKPYLAFLEDEMRAQQALINQAKQYALAREGWSREGWQGGLKMGLVDAQNTAATWQADQVASFLKSAPQAISQQMASSFIGYLQGKKVDFDALAWSMGEKLIQTQLEGFLTQLLPQAIQGLMQLLGIKLPAELTAAQTTATVLIGGGVGAGQAMIAAAIEAAAILKGGGGGGGGFMDAVSGIFKSFGGSNAPSLMSVSVPSSINPSGSAMLSVPIYGEGGIVNTPRLAIVGDVPEKITPLGQDRPQVNVIIYPAPNTQAKSETQPNGDIVVTFDQIGAQAYARRGQLYKAINSGSGAMKR